MHRTPIALFMLLAGIAIGVLIGFTVGSGDAALPHAMAAGLENSQRPSFQRAGLADSQNALESYVTKGSGGRSSIEPDLGEPLSIEANSPSGKLVAKIAAEAELAAPGDLTLGDGDAGGVISGVVLSDRGESLAGVTVETTMNPEASVIHTRSSQSYARGWRQEAELSETLRGNAESTLRRRRLKRVAVSDAEGRFTLTNLLPGKHRLYAYREGYIFDSRTASAGNATSFTGTLAESFELAVVDEQGAPLSEAIIGVSENDRWRYYEWSAKEPALLLRERSAKLKAFAGGPLLGDDDEPFAKYASEARRVLLDIDGEGPHEFQVKPTRSLCVSVIDKTTDGPTFPHSVAYASAKKLQEAGGRSAFTDQAREIRVSGDGRFRVPNLKEGDYLLGVGRGTDEPEVFKEFTITEGPVNETVELPPASADDFIIVKVYSPGGAALSGLSFSLWTESRGRIRAARLTSAERSAGEHWVTRPASLSSSDSPMQLVINSPAYGATMMPIGRDQRTLRVDFLEPCDLRVDVVGDAGETFKVELKVKESLGGSATRSLVSKSPKLTKGQGFVTFHGLQPGVAQLTLSPNNEGSMRYSSAKLAFAEIPTRSGEQLAVLTASTLHTLEVHAPDEEPGTRFRIYAVPDPGGLTLGGSQSGTLNESRVLLLQNLAPGRYTLSTRDDMTPAVEVTVPSSAITYKRLGTVGYRVSERRRGRDTAPLAPGDIITEVNGESVAVGSLSSRIGLAVAEGPATLTVQRDGDSIEIPIQTAPGNVRYTAVATLK